MGGKKWFVFSDRKDTKESFSRSKVIVTNGSVIFLSSSIKDINGNLVVSKHYLLAIWVCFGWFIVFDELCQNKESRKKRVLRECLYYFSHNPLFVSIDWQRQDNWLTSSYINCRVRADFPTPPAPTIITLRMGGWGGWGAVFILLFMSLWLLFFIMDGNGWEN